MKRNDRVEYRTPAGHRVLAIVRRAHRDGSYTVESRFFLNKIGKAEHGYLGYSFRLMGSDLVPAEARWS